MKQLIEDMAKALVDHPDQVSVKQNDGAQSTVFELSVHSMDVGKVIGKQGRTAAAMRLLLSACGMKYKRRFSLEIIE